MWAGNPVPNSVGYADSRGHTCGPQFETEPTLLSQLLAKSILLSSQAALARPHWRLAGTATSIIFGLLSTRPSIKAMYAARSVT